MKAIPTWQLARDYSRGAGLETLARRYPLSRTAILYRLRRAGVAMRRCGAPLGNQNGKGRALRASDDVPNDGPGDPIPGDIGYPE
jgi:hypothetical protein